MPNVSACYMCSTYSSQKQPPEVFCESAIPKNPAIFTGKHVCWRLFSIKLQAFLRTPTLKNICEQLLLSSDLKFGK